MFVTLSIIMAFNYSELKKNSMFDRMLFQNVDIIKDSLNINHKKKDDKSEENMGFLYKNNHYFSHYATAWEIFKDYPLAGVGLKNFRVYCSNVTYLAKVHPGYRNRNCATHPHNLYFEILSELDLTKSDKKLNKKVKSMDERNIDIVATATKLRKEYELLFRQLRDLVYPQKKRDD